MNQLVALVVIGIAGAAHALCCLYEDRRQRGRDAPLFILQAISCLVVAAMGIAALMT